MFNPGKGISTDVSAHCVHPNSSDLTIYSAHRLLLCASSPYLNLLLESSLKEKPNDMRSFTKGPVQILQQNASFPFDLCCNYNKIDNSVQLCLGSCCNCETQVSYNEHKFGNLDKYSSMCSDPHTLTHKFVSLKSFISDTKDVIIMMNGLDPVYFKYVLCSIYNETFFIEKTHIGKFLNFIKKLELSSYEIVKEKIMNVLSSLINKTIDTDLFQNIYQRDTLKFPSFNKLSVAREFHLNVNENIQSQVNSRNYFDNSNKYIDKEALFSPHHATKVHNNKLRCAILSRENDQSDSRYLHKEAMAKFSSFGSHSPAGFSFHNHCTDSNGSCDYDKEQREWLNFYNLANKFNNSRNVIKNLNEINNQNDYSTFGNCTTKCKPISEDSNVFQSMKCDLKSDVISTSVKNKNFKIANLLGEDLNNSYVKDRINFPSLLMSTSYLASSQTLYDSTSVYSSAPLHLNSRNSTLPLTVANCSSKMQFSNEMMIVNGFSDKFRCDEGQIEHMSVRVSGPAENKTSSHYSTESSKTVLEHKTNSYLHGKIDGSIKAKVLSNNKLMPLQCIDSIIPSSQFSVKDSATINEDLSNNKELVMISSTNAELTTVSCNQMINQECFTKYSNNIRCKKIKMKSRRSDKKICFQKPAKNSNSVENIPLKSITSIRVVSFHSMKSLRNKGSVTNNGIKVKSKYNKFKGSKCYFEKGCQEILPITLKKTRKDTGKSCVDTSDASLEIKSDSKYFDVFKECKLNQEATKTIFKHNFLKKIKNHSMSIQSKTNESYAITNSNKESKKISKVIVDDQSGISKSTDKCLTKACKKEIYNITVNASQGTVAACIICSFGSSSVTEMFEHVKSNHYNGVIKNAKCFDKNCPIKHIPYDSGEHIKHHILKFQHSCTKCSFSSRSLKGIRVHCLAHKKHDAMKSGNELYKGANSLSKKLSASKIICSVVRSNSSSLKVPATHSHNIKKCSSLPDIKVGGTLATSIIGKLCCGIVKKYKKFPNQYKLCLEKAIDSELSSSLSIGFKQVRPPLNHSANLLKVESKNILSMNETKKFEMPIKDNAQLKASGDIFKNKLDIVKNYLHQSTENSIILSIEKDKIKLNSDKKSEKSIVFKSDVKEDATETNKDLDIVKFNCLLCEATFNGSCDLADHCFTKHRFSLPIICPYKNCHGKLTCALQLRNHALSHTRKAKFDCSTCSYSCPTKNGISIHSKIHKERATKLLIRRH